MTIEERLRKEQRDKALELMRKRMILTPNKKRNRQEDGEWEGVGQQTSGQTTGEDRGRSQEGSPKPPRSIQTPVTRFLMPQTPEDRRLALSRMQRPRLRKEEDSQMSSSFASPLLKKSGRWETGSEEEDKKTATKKRMSKKMIDIKDYFENQAKKQENEPKKMQPNNNNAVSDPVCTLVCSRGADLTQRGQDSRGSHFEARISPE